MSVRKEAQSPEAQNRQLVSSKGNQASLYPLASPQTLIALLGAEIEQHLEPNKPQIGVCLVFSDVTGVHSGCCQVMEEEDAAEM